VAHSLHANDLGESLSDADITSENYVNDNVSIGSFMIYSATLSVSQSVQH
jgi:hypothetical protein